MAMPGSLATAVKRLCAAAWVAQVMVSVGAHAASSEMSPMQCGQPLAQRLTQAALASSDAV